MTDRAQTVAEQALAGLRLDEPIDEAAITRYRQARVRALAEREDVAAVLICDPVNLRYATGTRNMQVWTMHNLCRYALVTTRGPCVLFDIQAAQHLARGNPAVDEVRDAWTADYVTVAHRGEEMAGRMARDLVELVHEHGGANRRIAVDRLDPLPLRALEAAGLTVVDAQGILEHARAIKSHEEIRALVRSLRTCEDAVAVLREAVQPGMRENEALALLIAESVKRGGEYPETRLMTSGPRTNPWFQETSDRVMEAGDLLAFDTDLIGPMGFYNDISRTWLIGDGRPTATQSALYDAAYAQIETNLALLQPGTGLFDLGARAWQLAPEHRERRYADVGHGCGLGVEYPFLWYPEDAGFGAYDGVLEENMVICLESFVGEVDGREGVKLEQPVWLTRGGPVVLAEPLPEAL